MAKKKAVSKAAKSAKKTTAKKTTVKKSAKAKKATPKKAATKKAATKKAATKKATAKKSAKAKTSTAKKATAKKKVAPAKKAAVKKAATAKKKAVKKKVATSAPAASAPAVSSAKVVPTKTVPVVLGKHPQKTFPEKASGADFKCYGPPATRDGEFDSVKICDMGCFTQDGKDSNKYYHGAVVQNIESGNWYAYFEWGRTGAANPAFQFIGCRDEQHAQHEFAKQLHSKNDRRGEWTTVAGLRTLRARKGKDCYLVRPQATRSTGLPDARSIKINEGAKDVPAAKKKKKAGKPLYDQHTMSLMRDLAVGAIAYTRGSMADESLPTQQAIDEARLLLGEAKQRLVKVGDDLKKQVKDKQLLELTTLMYSRIPKKKERNAAASDWILSKDNILGWSSDLDAFETALYSTDIDHEADADFDPFGGVKIDMEWISPTSKVGKFLHNWWPEATANRHGGLGKMKVKNLWAVSRKDDEDKVPSMQSWVGKPKISERALFQPETREDLGGKDRKTFEQTNTALLFHGTRSVNVSGILREALRLPKQLVGVVITGAMFGPGLYFADDWKKSAGYTSLRNSYWSGGSGLVRGREAFMFACDVVLGSPFVAPKWGPYVEPPKGHHSVFGKAGESGVQNNEYIVYKPEQNRIRYLIEFTAS